jgi:hypothetical protein
LPTEPPTEMKTPQDFERVPRIAALSNNNTAGELAFTFPEIIRVIQMCTENAIAVLGFEIFLVKNDEYYASGCSTYDREMMRKWPVVQERDWSRYVQENNRLAEESVQSNPAGDDHVYLLSTSSWREFCEIQKIRRSGGPR